MAWSTRGSQSPFCIPQLTRLLFADYAADVLQYTSFYISFYTLFYVFIDVKKRLSVERTQCRRL